MSTLDMTDGAGAICWANMANKQLVADFVTSSHVILQRVDGGGNTVLVISQFTMVQVRGNGTVEGAI